MKLTNPAVDRLVKLCGMFGSEHDGERANAAAKADALVRSHNLVWADVIVLPTVKPEPERPREREENTPFWRRVVVLAAANPEMLTEWEREFVRSLMKRTHPPSDKQRAILDRIAEKLQGRYR